MPVYESDELTREKLEELRRKNVCAICDGWLNTFLGEGGVIFIACNDWLRTQHDGIKREARIYEPNIPTRRKMMEQEHGEEKTKALAKYVGVVSLTKLEAKEILNLVYPKAPDTEITRAVALCASYGLNPLMNHVFLIPFAIKGGGQSWATVIGIKAKRLLASRRGSYSYIDNTPRVMTKEEQIAVFGEENTTHICAITKLKDPGTRAEAVGYGTWPKGVEPYGTDKGNSKFNMATIRSESQALDRLRPGEMPMGVDVVPEEAIEADYEVISDPVAGDKGTPERIQVDAEETIPEEAEVEPETSPAKDETPITTQQLTELDAMMNKTGTDLCALGKYMNKDKGWKVQKLGDLKCWQFNEIMAAYEKGQEQPPSAKLL